MKDIFKDYSQNQEIDKAISVIIHQLNEGMGDFKLEVKLFSQLVGLSFSIYMSRFAPEERCVKRLMETVLAIHDFTEINYQ